MLGLKAWTAWTRGLDSRVGVCRLGLGTYPASYLPLTAPGYRRIGAGNGQIETSGHVLESL